MAWSDVLCREGVLRVEDRLTRIRRPDGTTVEVDLTVRAIGTDIGWVPELVTNAAGRVRVDGADVNAIQIGSSLENDLDRPPSTFPLPGYPRPDASTTRLAGTERALLVVDEAAHLSRWTTAFRMVLWIPQYAVLAVLSMVALVVFVIGWFGALAMGRLPTWAAEFLEGFVGYQTRVVSYAWLLTDRYPPFDFDAIGYPAQVEIPTAVPLRRWSVFFRGLLVLPASLLGGLAALGWGVASLLIWLVVLVRGRFPHALFQASVAVLRFSLRVNVYSYLLSSRYPRGLFGDQPDVPRAPSVLQPDVPPAPPARGTLVLTRSARALVVVFVVLGIVGVSAYGTVLAVVTTHQATKQSALDDATGAHNRLLVHVAAFRRATARCASTSDPLGCVEKADAAAATAFEDFGVAIGDIDPPGGADDVFANLETLTTGVTSALRELARSPDRGSYARVFQRGDLQARVTDFDTAYSQLVAQLSS